VHSSLSGETVKGNEAPGIGNKASRSIQAHDESQLSSDSQELKARIIALRNCKAVRQRNCHLPQEEVMKGGQRRRSTGIGNNYRSVRWLNSEGHNPTSVCGME